MRTIASLLVALALAGVATAQTYNDPAATDPAAGDGLNDPDAFGDPADDGPSVGAPGDQNNVGDPAEEEAVGPDTDPTPGDQGVNNAVWIALAIGALAVVGIAIAVSRRRHAHDIDHTRHP